MMPSRTRLRNERQLNVSSRLGFEFGVADQEKEMEWFQ